jgi:hypothetical protein
MTHKGEWEYIYMLEQEKERKREQSLEIVPKKGETDG